MSRDMDVLLGGSRICDPGAAWCLAGSDGHGFVRYHAGMASSGWMPMLLRRGAVALMLWTAFVLSASAQTIVEYIHTDALGSPVATTDGSGNIIDRQIYEPYGAEITQGLLEGPGFTGHVQDSATGLVYMQQRYMDPALGAFLSVDPVTADANLALLFNRYRYANDNPYRFTDLDGRFGRDCLGTLCESYRERGGRLCELVCVSEKSRSTGGLFRRHKTPRSQAALIESVGGSAETLKLAQETHEAFATTVIGVVAGGGIGAVEKSGTTTLYRAVSEMEAISVRATGKFSAGPNSLGGKWLAESLEHAKQWGDLLNGKGVSKLLEVKLPKPLADQFMRIERLDGIGPARYGELSQLEQAAVRELP